ncbi:uncharacterized protein [Palaemon carinicauda]|uniref:uncharacterized protein n=1 Tax=Palaemon carinicauda TaxID=392227 RepID=UPI0035B67CAB
MQWFLRPSPIDVDPESADPEDKGIMWHDNFEAFCAAINPDLNPDKLALLRAHISCKLFKIIQRATIYATAISLLKARFVKQKSEVFAIYKLATYKQQSGETLDAFLDNLKGLALECSFTDCTATQAEELAIRDSYIMGMASKAIRQRLLENLSLDSSTAVKQARALEMTQLYSASYASETNTTVATLIDDQAKPETDPNRFLIKMSGSPNPSECAAAVSCQRCFFCGGSLHPRALCPAKKASSSNSQKRLKLNHPPIFDNLTVDSHSIKVKSRSYSKKDSEFIEKKVKRLPDEGIITRVAVR